MNTSGIFKLGAKDFFKGLIVAATTAVIGVAYELLSTGVLFSLDSLKTIATFVGISVLGYLTKNLFTNNKGEFAAADAPVK